MLDLSMVSITPMRESDLTAEQKTVIKHQRQKCKFYTINDGQQRVATVCIIYAALRDTILHCCTIIEASEDMKTVLKGSTEAIAPIGLVRSDPRYPRVTSNSAYFKDLMLRGDGTRGVEVERPTKKQRVEEMDEDQRLEWVYQQIRQSLSQMIGPMFEYIDRMHELFVNLQYNATIILCDIANEKLAMRLVMSQRHGKDIGPVDYMKGMVCRNEKDTPQKCVELENKWRVLCNETGRDTLLTACLAVAQIKSGEPLRASHGNNATNFFEAKFKETIRDEGGTATFESIRSFALSLHDFRSDHRGLFANYSAEQKAHLLPCYRFLQTATEATTGKEMELILAAVLPRRNDSPAALLLSFRKLESIALWMLLSKPKPEKRRQRVVDLAHALHTTGGMGNSLNLSLEEKTDIWNSLMNGSFSSTHPTNKVPKAILERLNNVRGLILSVDDPDEVVDDGDVFVEVILQEYSLLGNFVVTETRPSRNRTTIKHKKKRFRESMFPLTREIGSMSHWDLRVIKKNHRSIIKAACSHWDLN